MEGGMIGTTVRTDDVTRSGLYTGVGDFYVAYSSINSCPIF